MRLKLALIALTASAGLASAHAPDVGHHGGPQTNAGAFHLEIVPNDKSLTVYLHDHGDKVVKPVGFTGTAIFVIDGKSEKIELAPGADDGLTGTAAVPLPASPKGVVQIKLPGGGTAQGQFK